MKYHGRTAGWTWVGNGEGPVKYHGRTAGWTWVGSGEGPVKYIQTETLMKKAEPLIRRDGATYKAKGQSHP